MKAAIYRFYSNVELRESQYICTLKAAGDINISEGVYKSLIDNLNKMNETIRATIEKGQTIVIPEINDTYLNSLLQ